MRVLGRLIFSVASSNWACIPPSRARILPRCLQTFLPTASLLDRRLAVSFRHDVCFDRFRRLDRLLQRALLDGYATRDVAWKRRLPGISGQSVRAGLVFAGVAVAALAVAPVDDRRGEHLFRGRCRKLVFFAQVWCRDEQRHAQKRLALRTK